ncbi:hypothetical protein UNDKW_4265 [Undibacterium sp. KW1]|uniref:hypothetical protein n=1 Tax=Undibacterium sp. KW1 TaxID=2058624 RepID=UPI001331CCC9|nr:hypothetical protein [Undibacterium sp. KW1]BBB62538.1 hypothetical protein UNDKW_4265 [Undibacterium sp. KW1]
MKTSLTDWLVTALAYIVICTVLSIINNEEDKIPGAEQLEQPEKQAAPASRAAARLHASVAASVTASASTSINTQLAKKMPEQGTARSELSQLAQEAERMTGFGARVQ